VKDLGGAVVRELLHHPLIISQMAENINKFFYGAQYRKQLQDIHRN